MGSKTLAWLKSERDWMRDALCTTSLGSDKYEQLRVRYIRVLNCIDKLTVSALQRRWHPEGR